MGLPLALGKICTCLAQRFAGVGGIQEFFAGGLIREEILVLHILCPYEIGDVVAHHPDEAVEIAEVLVGPDEFILCAFPPCDLTECDEVCLLSFEDDLRADPLDQLIVPMQIPHHIVAGVAFAPGAHVHEVGDDGLRVVRVGELKRALAYEHVGRWDADERSGRGIGEESSAIPVEDENSIHKGVEDLQIFFLQTGVAGRDDADDLHLREGGCGDCHGEDRAIMADQIDWVVPGCLLPADQADEFLPLRSIRPYSGEGGRDEVFRRVAEHSGESGGGAGDIERLGVESKKACRSILLAVFRWVRPQSFFLRHRQRVFRAYLYIRLRTCGQGPKIKTAVFRGKISWHATPLSSRTNVGVTRG